jgi:vesicle-fusing ATPase
MTGAPIKRGHLEEQTDFKITIALKDNKILKILSDQVVEKQIFKQNFNFQELGIGGLDKEFEEIFRKAFNLRRFPQKVLEKYGYRHLKGMLLYGPPGTDRKSSEL